MKDYADILVPVPFDSFTYSIPQQMRGQIMRGCRVIVPLGKSKTYVGVVLRVHGQCPQGVEVKEIQELLDSEPVVSEQQFKFWQWIANYYMCPLGDVFKAALPGGMKRALKRNYKTVEDIYKGQLGEAGAALQYKGLTEAQKGAMDAICESFESKDITLLHGVTSSGKTEIYIHLIYKYMMEGKQVLYLLPEIALTTQITERLQRVLGDEMGVYHSKFSDKVRFEVYQRQTSANPYKLILGVRSSVFLPFQNLGLIIVDEEHDGSYKQQEPAPRYHARNAALMLAKMCGAKTLLGTATPSFESYHYAKKGRYGYVQLTHRYLGLQLPSVTVVDIKEQRKRKLMNGAFSSVLVDAMHDALEKHQQVILFQNRRGYSSFIECKQCGWVPRCPHCDVSLTYHKKTKMMTCHYCGYATRPPTKCPNCEETDFTDVGLGTEKVEDQIHVIFPEAKTLRMDLDTAKTKNQYEQIIGAFSNREADILIGTQMVTKGLDFSDVSVVGVLNADTMLNQPDFRSYERSFQTLSQVAGRAGRKHEAGKVILQTKNGDADIIRQIAQNDYWGMYYQQMVERRDFNYPPFQRLIYIYLRHRDNDLLEHIAIEMAEHLRGVFGERVLGPDCPPVGRIQSLHIRKIMLKVEPTLSTEKVRQALNDEKMRVMAQPVCRNINIYFDVDPA